MISYRTLLLSRQPSKFTEPEVTAIIQQILPQLEQIHRQNLSHNNIDLDTIVTNQQQIFLLPSDYNQPANPSKDIYDLGMAMIELLTGKYPSLMKASDGSFNWDDYCTVSDQLIVIINRLITPNYYSHFRLAIEALSEQPIPSYQPPTVVPTPNYQAPTLIPTQPSSFISSPQRKWKMPLWGWAAIAGSFLVIILTAIALPNLVGQVGKAKESSAKNTIGAVIRGQSLNFLKTGQFFNSISELDPLDSAAEKFYTYNMDVIDGNRIIITGIPKEEKDKLGSYLGVIYLNNNQLISGICRTIGASMAPPEVPDLSGNTLPCPSGSTLVTSDSNPVSTQNAFGSSLSKDEAVSLINNWLGAKKRIFAPPYDRNFASEFLTGRAYQCNLGAIDWLQNNGAYYTYGVQSLDEVLNFNTNNDQATIEVKFTEQRTLHNRNGGIDRNASKFKQSTLLYNLQRENGQWKISYFELPQC